MILIQKFAESFPPPDFRHHSTYKLLPNEVLRFPITDIYREVTDPHQPKERCPCRFVRFCLFQEFAVVVKRKKSKINIVRTTNAMLMQHLWHNPSCYSVFTLERDCGQNRGTHGGSATHDLATHDPLTNGDIKESTR